MITPNQYVTPETLPCQGPEPEILKGRYCIERKIGSGQFGTTYLARDILCESDKDERRSTLAEPDLIPAPDPPNWDPGGGSDISLCVIKQFTFDAAGHPFGKKAEKMFEEEACVLSRLCHRRIPRLLDSFTEGSHRYHVMEFVHGRDLQKEADSGVVYDECIIRRLLFNILDPLCYMHAGGILHRDVKPSNIVHRDWDDTYFLVDFGIARQCIGCVGTTSGTAIGTLEYSAPEQLAGMCSAASDLYSVAATAVALMTRVDRPSLYFFQRWDDKKAPVSRALGRVLKKMLSFQVEDRYQDAAHVIDALNASDGVPRPLPLVACVDHATSSAPSLDRNPAAPQPLQPSASADSSAVSGVRCGGRHASGADVIDEALPELAHTYSEPIFAGAPLGQEAPSPLHPRSQSASSILSTTFHCPPPRIPSPLLPEHAAPSAPPPPAFTSMPHAAALRHSQSQPLPAPSALPSQAPSHSADLSPLRTRRHSDGIHMSSLVPPHDPSAPCTATRALELQSVHASDAENTWRPQLGALVAAACVVPRPLSTAASNMSHAVLRIGNDYFSNKDHPSPGRPKRNPHVWRMYVRALGVEWPHVISQVDFFLNPTFRLPVVSLTRHPFQVDRTGFSTFDVKVVVHLRDKALHQFVHTLVFTPPGAYNDYPVLVRHPDPKPPSTNPPRSALLALPNAETAADRHDAA